MCVIFFIIYLLIKYPYKSYESACPLVHLSTERKTTQQGAHPHAAAFITSRSCIHHPTQPHSSPHAASRKKNASIE